MGRDPSPFTESAVHRAVKAVKKAGVEVARVEISRDGNIVIYAKATDSGGQPELDQWLKKRGRHADAT